MADQNKTYTYRNGKKVYLKKEPDQFVVRSLPENLPKGDFISMEKVSSVSTKVRVDGNELENVMSESRMTAPTHHAYYTEKGNSEFLITDRILVSFKKELKNEKVDVFAGKYGLLKLEKYTDKDYLFLVTEHSGMNPVKLVVKLTETDPLVAFAENDLNQRMKKYDFILPTDPVYNDQWHLHKNYSGADFDQRSSSRCDEAWMLLDNFGSSDVVIGVTDDGCKLDHGDFNSPEKFETWGYMTGSRLVTKADIDADPVRMYEAGANHGTSCNGVIGAEADGTLTVGAAPACKLSPIKWESDGASLFISDSKFLTVLNFISDKVDVLSNSWGSSPTSFWSTILLNKIQQLAQTGGRRGTGIIFVFAAGNENCPIAHDSGSKIPFNDGWSYFSGSWHWVGVDTSKYFAHNLVGISGVLHVAAIASNAQRSHYTNYGTGIDLCAPSSNVHSYYRLTVQGLGITTTTGEDTGIDSVFGGTSSATPLVAGIAGLVISANPDLSALEVISVLKQTASKELDMEGYSRTPPASYDMDTSWDISPVSPFSTGVFKNIDSPDGTWSPWFGYGKVDAYEAVKKALSMLSVNTAESVKIVSALVNPAGTDRGNEKIILLNTTTSNINLSGWILKVKAREQTLNGQISAGGTTEINIDNSKVYLTNTGASITLSDSQNNTVDEVSYMKEQVKSGKIIVF